MDCSKNYILMCEKAEEIQEYFLAHLEDDSFQQGIWFSPKYNLESSSDEFVKVEEKVKSPRLKRGEVYVSGYFIEFGDPYWCDVESFLDDKTLVVWLPRQDQLQEMVKHN